MHVPRDGHLRLLARALSTFPAAVVLGPRQCGKSTLVREFAASLPARTRVKVLDLERTSDLARVSTAAEEYLGDLQAKPGLVCIDEVQRVPGLLALLRPLLDDPRRRARYILLGSASPSLIRGVSESLAGRVGFLDLPPLLAAEVGAGQARRLWLRGGFPRSHLARSERASIDWREAHVRTFLEQDVPALGLRFSAASLRRLWTMLAHLHGGILNGAEVAGSLGVSAPTVFRWLDLLEGAFVVRRLAPFFANVGKRIVKAPRVYLRDTGLLHALLGIETADALHGHPKVGASWEGWVIEQTLGALRLAGERVTPFYWRTHGGAEVDLVLETRGRRIPVEIKLRSDPVPSRGLFEAMKDLGARTAFVVHGGRESFPLGRGVRAIPSELVASPDVLRRTLLAT